MTWQKENPKGMVVETAEELTEGEGAALKPKNLEEVVIGGAS